MYGSGGSGRARTFDQWIMSPLGLNIANGETLEFSTHLCAKTPGIDVMQDGRFELNLKLLGRVTHRECDKPRKITNQV